MSQFDPLDAAQTDPTRPTSVVQWADGAPMSAEDTLAAEAPLELRLGYTLRGRPAQKTLAVTMRTPGHDAELAVGFLLGEGIIAGPDDLVGVERCADEGGEAASAHILRVVLADHVEVDTAALTRHFYTTSSCGVCGKASIAALTTHAHPTPPADGPRVNPRAIAALPARLRAAQALFERTGGLHAAALFHPSGEPVVVREDVGRHNAMDKVVGAALDAGLLPLGDHIVVWSGRASFELVQKAVMAGATIALAVGAASTLAVDLAEHFGLTLVGFARHDRFNVYTHPERIDAPEAP